MTLFARSSRLVFLLLVFLASRALARGGPENALLVVNPRSPDSMCIANHYTDLRHIPGPNLLYVDWDPEQETTDVKTFREKILTPVMRFARLPVPGRQIDYVIYSSGFPWGIKIDDDIKKVNDYLEEHEKEQQGKPGEKASEKASEWVKFMRPLASINGLTYLWEPVINATSLSGIFYIHPHSNWYARTGLPDQKNEPTLSFSSAAAYDAHGQVTASAGRRYVLSMVLGVTSGRGNSVDEVLNYLQRSAAADGTHPKGTIYFMQNADVRSKVRQPGFLGAVKQLKALGVAAEVIDGIMPMNKPDVQGAMLGIADFKWKESGSTILPGAICEHFTSFGGLLSAGADQTPLSEWLRYGAAAASGTVTEPYAIAAKFPMPAIQVHYARGCTVAESFYQSVLCPFQLLIVGDPLCRPWANIPEITVDGLNNVGLNSAGPNSAGPVHGVLKLMPRAKFAAGIEPDHFELVLDAQRIRECKPGGTLEFDSSLMADGAHEIRVVAESAGPLISRGEKIIEITTANHERTIEVTCVPEKTVALAKSLTLTVKSPKSALIRVIRGTRLLRMIAGDSGQIEIPASALGRGPVRIQVIGVGDKDPKSWVFAPPLDITVTD